MENLKTKSNNDDNLNIYNTGNSINHRNIFTKIKWGDYEEDEEDEEDEDEDEDDY